MLRSLLLISLLTSPQDPGPTNGNGYGIDGGLNDRLPAAVLMLPEGGYAILVEKATQTLVLYGGSADGVPRPLHIMRTNTGEEDGDKYQEGDMRTPEGIYFFGRIIDGRTLPAEYGVRAFTTDYPNIFDRLDGKDGSNIWLHATDDPERVWDGRNTRGCVVVTNEGLETLTPAISMGPLSDATPIIVKEHFDLLDLPMAASVRDEMDRLVRSWVAAWESRDTERYMDHYSPDFRGMGRTFQQWSDYKGRLNNQYSFIEVDIEDLRMFSHDSEMVVMFNQSYTSDYYRAESEKRLYLRRETDSWKIVEETGYIT
ncbi:L,D-transpeptidase family protein, partial [Gemmatimonadota bacterium]